MNTQNDTLLTPPASTERVDLAINKMRATFDLFNEGMHAWEEVQRALGELNAATQAYDRELARLTADLTPEERATINASSREEALRQKEGQQEERQEKKEEASPAYTFWVYRWQGEVTGVRRIPAANMTWAAVTAIDGWRKVSEEEYARFRAQVQGSHGWVDEV